MKKPFLPLVWGVSLLSTSLVASEAYSAEEPLSSHEVVVTATRTPTPRAEVGSSITVITRQEIEQKGYVSLVDILRTVPGVSVARNGGLGSVSNIRIRGADTAQSLVLIDGVRVGDPSSIGGAYDFANMLVGDIERVEVLRGPQSALYGSDAMGGVVNIITRKGSGPLKVGLEAEGGSRDTFRQKTTLRGAMDQVDYALAYQYLTTDGFDRLKADMVHDDDNVINQGVSGQVGLKWTDSVKTTFRGGWALLDSEYDDSFNAYYPWTRDERVNGSINNEISLLDKKLKLNWDISGSQTDRYDNGAWGNTTYTGERIGSELRGRYEISDSQAVSAGVERRYEKMKSDSTWSSLKKDYTTDSAFAQYELGLMDKTLFITPGLRYDHNSQFGDSVTGRLVGSYLVKSTDTRLKASVGTATKAPSLYQLYDPFAGNADLKKEESVGFDVGVEQTFLSKKASVGVTYFHNDFKNLIDYVYNPVTFSGQYVNVAKAMTEGVEVEGRYRILPTLEVKGSYTRLHGVNKIDETELPRRPEDTATVGVTWTGISQLTVGTDVSYVSKQRNSNFSADRTSAYTLMDANVQYKLDDILGKKVTLFGRMENAFDADYEEVMGYNTPGFSVFAGVRSEF